MRIRGRGRRLSKKMLPSFGYFSVLITNVLFTVELFQNGDKAPLHILRILSKDHAVAIYKCFDHID